VIAPTLPFMLHHPAHFIALGGGAGLAPFAPGTFGTLVAIPIALVLERYAGDVGFALAIAALFVVGAWASGVTGRALGVPDHGCIVIDEVVAFLLVLFFAGVTPLRIALAFVLFRFFDIVKPPRSGRWTRRSRTAWGSCSTTSSRPAMRSSSLRSHRGSCRERHERGSPPPRSAAHRGSEPQRAADPAPILLRRLALARLSRQGAPRAQRERALRFHFADRRRKSRTASVCTGRATCPCSFA
jgi:phosphatidylglycerophosphatase A